jgi:hypothetical protein
MSKATAIKALERMSQGLALRCHQQKPEGMGQTEFAIQIIQWEAKAQAYNVAAQIVEQELEEPT